MATPYLLQLRPTDGGPIYVETNMAHLVKEPFNMASAALFFFLALYWMWRLQGNTRKQWLLAVAQPILLVGSIGGTLFHGFRLSRVFLIMDFMPILILLLFVSIYLWVRLLPRWWYVLLVIPPFFLLQFTAFQLLGGPPRRLGISISYSIMALMVLTPLLLTLRRVGWQQARWVFMALGSFALAVVARFMDDPRHALLPMGTHFLWHVFGALATALLMEWLYRYFEGLGPQASGVGAGVATLSRSQAGSSPA